MIQIYFILFTVIYLLCLVHYYKRVNTREFVLNPIVILSVFFYIIHVWMPYYQWENNWWRYTNGYDESIYIFSLISIGVAFLFLIAGFKVFGYGKDKNIKIDISDSYKEIKFQRITIVTFILFLIGAYFGYQDFVAIGALDLDYFIRNRIAFSYGRGFATLIVHWMYICCILFFVVFKISTNPKIKRINLMLFVLSLGSSVVFFSTNQNRNSLFIFLITIIIMSAFFMRGRLKLKNIFMYVLVGTLFFALFHQVGQTRRTLGGVRDVEQLTIFDLLNNSFGNHENAVWLMSNEQELLYGKTYVAGIANFIPRRIWSDKPLGAGPALKNMIHPGSYVAGEAGVTSLTTGLFTELYMNFGWIGLFVFSFLYGMLLKKMYLILISTHTFLKFFFWFFILISFSAFMLYGEFLGIFTRTIFSAIPFLILSFVNRLEIR